jgi:regulator of protease activity HflC (stomatin/prohibitin superfamily)
MRYEIRDIRMPARVQEAMQMQVEAERKKRAAILESEGIKAAEINIAEGKKQSRILASGKRHLDIILLQINKLIVMIKNFLRHNIIKTG